MEETGSDTESTTCERLSMNLSKQRSLAEILSQPTWYNSKFILLVYKYYAKLMFFFQGNQKCYDIWK